MITDNQGDKIRKLFDSAIELPVEERKTYLRQACNGDTALVHQALALLECAEEDDLDPSRPIVTPSMRDRSLAPLIGSLTPTQIGPYRVIKKIGSGSMGTVYEAHQDALQRNVAVKLLRASVSTDRMLQRFEFEAHALGQLNHPYIAKIFDVGTTQTKDGAQPYIAMEYVPGVPLNEYIEEVAISTAQRISLLIKICDAIHHAHQRGIIHRDLKPGNILVDQDGQPRIVDFGVARNVDHDIETMTHATEIGELLGTLSYMSPEQASGQQVLIDTQTDVYALGIIGYELIADQLPFNIDKLPLADAIDQITNSTPQKIGTIHTQLRGDLELIVSTAMHRDKSHRYQSASDFASDLRRYQDDRPILARPPSIYYQMSKYAKRNKAWFTGAVAAMIALMLGVMGTTYGFIRAVEQRTIAENRLLETQLARDESETVTSLLARIIESVNPSDLGRDVRVLDLLDEAAAGIDEDLTTNPLVKARLRHTIGTSYFGLGQYTKAELQLEKALAIRRSELGQNHVDTAATAARLAQLFIECDRFKEALPLVHDAHSTQLKRLGQKHKSTLDTANSLAILYYLHGQYDKAEPLYKQNLTLQRETLGYNHINTMDTEFNLAQLYIKTKRLDQAKATLDSLLKRHQLTLGENHPSTLTTWHAIAEIMYEQRNLEESLSIIEHVLAVRTQVLGEVHPRTLRVMDNLSDLHAEMGQLAQAESYTRKLLHIQQRLMGTEDPNIAASLNQLGGISIANGKLKEAETLLLKSLELSRQRFGDEHTSTLSVMENLAIVYTRQDRYDEAEALHLKSLDIQQRVSGEKHSEYLATIHNLAALRIHQEKLTEAEPLCLKEVSLSREKFGDEHPDTLNALNTLAVLYDKQGRSDEAENLYLSNLDTQKRVLGPNHELAMGSMNNLGDLYNTLHRYDDAEILLSELVETSRKVFRKDHPNIGIFLSKYGKALVGLQRYHQAETALVEARDILSKTLEPNNHRIIAVNETLSQVYKATGRPKKTAAQAHKNDHIN